MFQALISGTSIGKFWKSGLEIFGPPHVGAHLMVGMGETEKQMVALMERLWHMGVMNHLFAFFAEEGSQLGNRPQPPWPTYLGSSWHAISLRKASALKRSDDFRRPRAESLISV